MKCEECPQSLSCYANKVRASLCPVCGSCTLYALPITEKGALVHKPLLKLRCSERPLTSQLQNAFVKRTAQHCHDLNLWEEELVDEWLANTVSILHTIQYDVEDPGPTDRDMDVQICFACQGVRVATIQARDEAELPNPLVFYLENGTHETACMAALYDLFQRIVALDEV